MSERSTSIEQRDARPRTAHRIGGIPESSTVRIADIASMLKRRGENVVDFSAGRAAESTHAFIYEAAVQAMESGHTHQTPARGIPGYLDACAEKLARDNGLAMDPETEIIATAGCKEGLLLALLAVIDPGDEVIVEDPCFVSYQPEITLCGGTAVPVALCPENDNRWAEEDLAAAVTRRTRAIVMCSPNNPLGVVHTRDDLEALRTIAVENDLIVVVDEIYDAAVWGGRKHLPIASLPGMRERTVGLMGMTKSYSMGGWRIGYAYAHAGVIEKMVVVQQHVMTCASSIGQHAGIAALSEQGITVMQPIWEDWERRCMRVADGINQIPGLSTNRPEGAFYAWVDIGRTGLKSMEFASRLLESQKVAVVPGGSFGTRTDDHVRITCVRSPTDIEEGLRRISTFVESV